MSTLMSAQEMIRVECQEVQRILLEKNAAYGNSALEPIRIFSRADATEQIRVRLDDKLSRLARGHAAGEDVIIDLIGYLILLRIAQHQQKTASSPLESTGANRGVRE